MSYAKASLNTAPGMVGVRGKLQACYEPEDQDHFANAYDAFMA
jgi:hypothetical protein